jgi:hypothetical protein
VIGIKNVIITCSDSKCGDFLVNHWLKSLKDNVDLRNIDIAIISYGLKKKHKTALKKENVLIFEGKYDGKIVNVRFRDTAHFLATKNYDQVLFADGGDIIFQTDISCLFEKNKNKIRISYEETKVPYWKYSLLHKDKFKQSDLKKMYPTMNKKPTVNAGVIIAPAKEFSKICRKCFNLIKDKSKWGSDQLALNYLIYKEGFTPLDSKYNFNIWCVEKEFYVSKGKFFLKNGELIPIVHNAGRSDLFRPIENFGYGRKYNKIKPFSPAVRKFLFRLFDNNYILKKHPMKNTLNYKKEIELIQNKIKNFEETFKKNMFEEKEKMKKKYNRYKKKVKNKIKKYI